MHKKFTLHSSIRKISSILLLTLLFSPFLILESCKQSQSAVTDSDSQMDQSVPVWAEGREKEMNLTLGFRGVFTAGKNDKTQLRIAASTVYRVYLNGKFVGSGPARAGHGYFRVDQYDVTDRVKDGENIVAIEVAGYNVNTYYTTDQPSFLQAEAAVNGNVVLSTGANDQFEAFEIKERLQKVERYSFQRPFTEYYRMDEGYDEWRNNKDQAVQKVTLAEYPSLNLLPRHVPIPDFTILKPVALFAKGTTGISQPAQKYKDRSLVNISEKFKGYPESDLTVIPSQQIQEMVSVTKELLNDTLGAQKPLTMKKDDFYILDFGINHTGFIGATITCKEPSTIWFHFDEMLTDNDVISKKRMADVNNQVVYELQPGTYNIESFEPYTLKFLKIMVAQGACTIENIYIREFAYPDNPDATFTSSNEKLNRIFDASKQTFRQNSVDVFTDCPSRERAGWLCDSYFTAIMEKEFTGDSKVAHNFYENYALPEKFEYLPEGMIPMCYPADHNDGVFIPNWSLWFIIQVDDYAKRGGDEQLVSHLKGRITDLLGYFAKFENEDGLLEKLESWIFVEWSKANSLVQDVNYPTNMLYSAALASAANLYGNKEWQKKSDDIREQIQKQSYNGEFFVDNAIRKDSILTVTDQITEVCQYYAFFFDIATPQSHPELWNKISREFGPNRDVNTTYPNVAPANAFIGNYLRMDILSKQSQQSQLISEIQDYFYYMAERTGTLWENVHSQASCNHGFASYIGHVLYRDVLGVSNIDYLNKEITIRFSDIDLESCRGTIPVKEEVINLEWRRTGDEIQYLLQVPKGYKVHIDNRSSAKLTKMSKK